MRTMSFYREYNEAFNAAVRLGRLLRREVGLEKADNPLDGRGFRVFSIPKPEHRFGHELRCQVVRPDECLMGRAPEPVTEVRAEVR
jgi:hypothetical protein